MVVPVVGIKSHRKLQIRSPKIANAKTYAYPRIQLLPYVIRICILHISLRVYSLDSGADNSNYHLDKIVSNLQVLVIKTGKFTKTMSIGLLQMLFGYSFVSSTYLFCPSDRYLQLSVTLYTHPLKSPGCPGHFLTSFDTISSITFCLSVNLFQLTTCRNKHH